MLNFFKSILFVAIIGLSTLIMYRNYDEILILLNSETELINKKNSESKSITDHTQSEETYNSRAEQFKKIILKYKNPSRIELLTQTKKFQEDIAEIKNMKFSLDEESQFYLKVQLFSDDTDNTAPLVMQIQFIKASDQSLLDEQSFNL